MNTKYILHGGINKEDSLQQDYFDEMVVSLHKKEILVLYVPFAEQKDAWEEKTRRKQQQFSKFLPQKSIQVLMAKENPENFLDQTHGADIIYFGGGDTQRLLEFLQKIPTDILAQHLTNKVVVGSSAGANALSKYYVSFHRKRIEEATGILPIKVFSHYTRDKEDQLVELEHYKEHLTSFALPENEFVVIR